mmetsp:Transcript_20734/g.45558  ORF Transcript_20734/g.45558 Transcript_20734/m.45558 type:complete len:325 (-) Transcript_20734:57-1031(-)
MVVVGAIVALLSTQFLLSGALAGGSGAAATKPHVLQGKYGLLRSSSNRVGKAVAAILQSQGELNDMRQELSSEYSAWREMQKTLMEERDRRQEEVAQLRDQVLQSRALENEKQRLQEGEHARLQRHAALVADAEGKRKAWGPEQQRLKEEIAKLEAEMESTQQATLGRLAISQDSTQSAQRQREDAKAIVSNLDEQVALVRSTITEQITNASRRHGDLQATIDALEKNISMQANEVNAHAKMKETEEYLRNRLKEQSADLPIQKDQLRQSQDECNKALAQLDAQIELATQEFLNATVKYKRCQVLEGDTQGLQKDLTCCQKSKR